jgi:hypothetical protein
MILWSPCHEVDTMDGDCFGRRPPLAEEACDETRQGTGSYPLPHSTDSAERSNDSLLFDDREKGRWASLPGLRANKSHSFDQFRQRCRLKVARGKQPRPLSGCQVPVPSTFNPTTPSLPSAPNMSRSRAAQVRQDSFFGVWAAAGLQWRESRASRPPRCSHCS